MSRLKIVSYAINGRGMGHLVRQLAILRWVRRLTAVLDVRAECWVLTSSEADTLARREGFPSLKLASKAMMRDAGIEPARYLTVARTWVLNAIAGLQPDLLIVDTFPGGSFGELISALELARHRVLVARRVKDELAEEDGYRALLPLYERHIAPDDRDTGPILIREREEMRSRDQAREALGVPEGRRAVYVTLGGGGDEAAPAALPTLTEALVGRGWHVVVGAGPLYTGPERRGPHITWMDRYVPLDLFFGLDAAVSAGGYNAYHELMYAGVPTVFLPQARIADDQAARCRRAVEAGAGRIAPSVREVPDLLEALGPRERASAMVPENGARRAAIAALETVLPAADLRSASELFGPRVLRFLSSSGAQSAQGALELVKLLAGRVPSEVSRERAVLQDLAERGHPVPRIAESERSTALIEAFVDLVDSHAPPIDTALALVRDLTKKFPGAEARDVVQAARLLFPAWARFDDWMGAVSMMRAVPVQRGYSILDFAAEAARWLEREEDLFDALRSFSRLENAGALPVSEVLNRLAVIPLGEREAGA